MAATSMQTDDCAFLLLGLSGRQPQGADGELSPAAGHSSSSNPLSENASKGPRSAIADRKLNAPGYKAAEPGLRAQVSALPRKEWSAEEDAVIKSGVEQMGFRWRLIAAQLPGRSDDAVRNRWSRIQEALRGGEGGDRGSGGSGGTEAAEKGEDGSGSCDGSEGSEGTCGRGAAGAAEGGAAEGGGGSRGGAKRGSKDRGGGSRGAGRKGGGSKAARAAGSGAGEEGVEGAPITKKERTSWTRAEDEVIMAGVAELGHKWYEIARRLPGRTDHAIRNRWSRLQSILAMQDAHPGAFQPLHQRPTQTDSAAPTPRASHDGTHADTVADDADAAAATAAATAAAAAAVAAAAAALPADVGRADAE